MPLEVKNPFSKIRTEQMGDSAWRYFVEPSKEYINDKPLIYEGGRGTGKTMFFKCNSWKEKYAESASVGDTLNDFLSKVKHIGFYYKVDGRFVKSLTNKNVENSVWSGIFNTYFNLVIIKEVTSFIKVLEEENVIQFHELNDVMKLLALSLEIEQSKSLAEFTSNIDFILLKIEKFSNYTSVPDDKRPVGLNAGTLIEKLLLSLKRIEILQQTTFHIFIDEYEVLSIEQQIIINTLLKQSDNNIVYDFGVITNGIYSFATTSGQDLRRKDDYFLFSMDRYGYYESGKYNKLLQDICAKRLKEEFDKSGANYNQAFIDISFYLKSYGRLFEEEEIIKSERFLSIKNRLYHEIQKQTRSHGYSKEEVEFYYQELINCSAINIRIHLALLSRKNQNTVAAKDLVKNKIDKTDKYNDWCHNMEIASLYLLCHECRLEKKYHGFQVFSALSSGVIRSFLELAEYAFDYAFEDTDSPFSFENPREFTVEEQTKAVYFVSNLKIKEIESYDPPYGYVLKDFTKALGQIFKNIQLNPQATLGEVEQNHFSTGESELSKKKQTAYDLFKLAIKNKILEDEEPTKTKSNNLVETSDYYLNHIYCPTFGISHRRKNKIKLSYLELSKLLSGNQKEIEEVIRSYSTLENSLPSLFSENQ